RIELACLVDLSFAEMPSATDVPQPQERQSLTGCGSGGLGLGAAGVRVLESTQLKKDVGATGQGERRGDLLIPGALAAPDGSAGLLQAPQADEAVRTGDAERGQRLLVADLLGFRTRDLEHPLGLREALRPGSHG